MREKVKLEQNVPPSNRMTPKSSQILGKRKAPEKRKRQPIPDIGSDSPSTDSEAELPGDSQDGLSDGDLPLPSLDASGEFMSSLPSPFPAKKRQKTVEHHLLTPSPPHRRVQAVSPLFDSPVSTLKVKVRSRRFRPQEPRSTREKGGVIVPLPHIQETPPKPKYRPRTGPIPPTPSPKRIKATLCSLDEIDDLINQAL